MCGVRGCKGRSSLAACRIRRLTHRSFHSRRSNNSTGQEARTKIHKRQAQAQDKPKSCDLLSVRPAVLNSLFVCSPPVFRIPYVVLRIVSPFNLFVAVSRQTKDELDQFSHGSLWGTQARQVLCRALILTIGCSVES